VHPRPAWKRKGCKGGALRLDDLKEILVKESRKGSCTYWMDGARKIDAAKACQKARAKKAAALVIKL